MNRLVSPASFKAVLIGAALVETLHLWFLFDRRVAVDGTALALFFTFLVPWAPFLLGLAVLLWRSRLAAVALIVLVALAWVAGWRAGTAAWATNPTLLIGALATLLQTAAALMLLTLAGRRWWSNRPS